MSACTLRLTGPSARGRRVAAPLLRDLLDTLVDAVQQSVRLRAEGRSRTAGPAPAWLTKAASFEVEIREGSTQLVLEAPPLGDVAPERFAQVELFDPIGPDKTCLDVFADAVDDALGQKADSDLYDDGLVETLESFGHVLDHDIDGIEVFNGRSRRIDRNGVASLRELRRRIPREQRARVAGNLDVLRHSNRTFALLLEGGETLRGAATPDVEFSAIRPLLGEQVVVSGLARFRPSGRVLRIEADRIVAAEGDTAVWATAPRPLLQEIDVRALRLSQGPKSGVAAIFGQWPGDETDEAFDAAVRSLS